MGKVWQGEEGRCRHWLAVELTIVVLVATLEGHALCLIAAGLCLGRDRRRASVRRSRLLVRRALVVLGAREAARAVNFGGRGVGVSERAGCAKVHP